MPISLHTATVSSWLQTLPAIAALLDTAEAHCRARGVPDEALTSARLAEDMWPFATQVRECVRHSAQAIDAVRDGVARPKFDEPPLDFPALKAHVLDGIASLASVEPEWLESLAGREIRLEVRAFVMPFTVENFLLSFTMPNFYFHATTVYAILRAQGLPIGKRDFLGRLRTLPSKSADG